ncbi:MAG TPA: hypothetical protein VMX16_03620 [Terriglobia bacterium]|nr:hypothetical protein [Terriglobia bacterium]
MKDLKRLFGAALVLVAASVLIRTIIQSDNAPAQDTDDKQQAIHVPSRVSVVNGQTMVALDASTQKRLDISVSPLRAVNTRPTKAAAATVLVTQGIVPLRNAYVAVEAQVETAQAQLAVSRQEYGRLKALYAQNQNASKKALEAAEGLLRTDRASLDAAQKQLEIAQWAVEQAWGGAVAGWVAQDSPTLKAVLTQRAVLVEVTLPPGSAFQDPPAVTLSTPNGDTVEASYVSPFPQVDPRIQGVSLLYVARSYPSLEPGMNLAAHLPAGKRLRGVLIPRAAVIWWQGQAWVYEQTAPGRFARRPVSTDEPLQGGYFAAQGFAPGAQVVTRGAQEMLSEEFRSHIQAED